MRPAGHLDKPAAYRRMGKQSDADCKGKADPAAFMEGIENMARELVKTYPFLSDDKAQMFKPEREALGSCPRCGSPVYEGKKTTIAATKNVSLPCGK